MIKICSNCHKEYEAKTEDSKICYPCFKEINNLREIVRDEVVFDIDNRTEQGLLCYMQTAMNLVNAEYHIEIYYADGQKEPHIHVKNIPHIAELKDNQLKEYKTLLLEKYIPKEFWNNKIPDYSLCNPHLVAEENKPHMKYKTPKLLRSEFNLDKPNFCEIELYYKVKDKENYKAIIKGSGITAKIIQAINIKDIAKQFGLSLQGNKCVCPFHAEGKPSLTFSAERGLFLCYGCQAKGNIIKFYAMLKELNPNFRYTKQEKPQ